MRMAGDYLSNSLQATPVKDKPLVQDFNAEDFQQQPKEVALAPAVAAGLGILGKGLKIYGASKFIDGGRINPGTKADYAGQDPTTQPGTESSNRRSIGGALMQNAGKFGLGGMLGGI